MRFENSKKLYEEAKKMVPGGVSSSIRQTEWPVPGSRGVADCRNSIGRMMING